MIVGKRTALPNILLTWPHQVLLGSNCRLEHGIRTKSFSICIGDNVLVGNHTEFNISNTLSIGKDCLIAAECRFVDHNHGCTSIVISIYS